MSAAKAQRRPHLSAVKDSNLDPRETLVPEGVYVVAFDHLEKKFLHGGNKWFGHFTIVSPEEFSQTPILRYWNEPKGAYLAQGHHLYRDFMNVTKLKPPKKGLKPADFLEDCQVEVKVVTVDSYSDGGERIMKPESCWTSKISRIIRITAGCPPCMRNRRRTAEQS